MLAASAYNSPISDRIRATNWDKACFIILLILFTVVLIDTVSKTIRLRELQSF